MIMIGLRTSDNANLLGQTQEIRRDIVLGLITYFAISIVRKAAELTRNR